ncbi:hypothetical protein M8181_12995 [Bacillus licheniformis]|nr:hypothetical protein LXN06_13060 [Bacillus licheniformis]WIY54998.1 hypothetical protein M8181_12995 [Bacillus licheniformis]
MHHITEILPDTIKRALSGLDDHEIDQIEEIRIRIYRRQAKRGGSVFASHHRDSPRYDQTRAQRS